MFPSREVNASVYFAAITWIKMLTSFGITLANLGNMGQGLLALASHTLLVCMGFLQRPSVSSSPDLQLSYSAILWMPMQPC